MFIGEKVRLRAYKKEDVKKAQEYMNDWEIRRNLVENVPFPFTYEDENKWYESNTATKDTYSFAIETVEGGEYIGGCGINNVDWKNGVAMVGIFIGNREYLSRGYGTEAMKLLIKFVFNEMNVNKITLGVYSFNERAIKSYLKCGYREEGRLRQELFREGKYHDIVRMGILRKEYEAQQDAD